VTVLATALAAAGAVAHAPPAHAAAAGKRPHATRSGGGKHGAKTRDSRRGRRASRSARRAAATIAGVPVATIQRALGLPADGVYGARTKAAVRRFQRALGVPGDGIYGPRTRAALRRFQRRHGLAVDGIAGPRTLAALGLARRRGAHTAAAPATLERIARCESGGDPTAVSPDGRYRGKYQFDRATWRRMGGTGDPAKAPEVEQDRIAAKLLGRSGTSPWPACG
jgi:lysozyme family protein